MNILLKKTIINTGTILGTAFIGLSAIAITLKGDSQYDKEPEQKNPMEGKTVIFVEDPKDKENADGFRGHLEAIGDSVGNNGFYETYGKRVLDIILSFGGLIVLSPVLLGTAIAIKIDDPGPVLFIQKRIGKNKRYFKFHKFRSMKMSTPHDVPTHMLDNPEQYITRVGKFLRAHSLDELPQIWDIFIGNMSVIGPRPALWNQDVLTAEREKYGVNEIKPGLTGWAQINGRDELKLSEKARLDGEYVQKESLQFDINCFLGSVHVFRKDESVVEGGTGEIKKSLRKGVPAEDPATVFGCDLDLIVDKESTKRVLITGKGSYIGESVKEYAKNHYPNIKIDAIDMIDGSWRDYDFSPYDCVYHVAGIAHADVGNVSDEIKEKYYRINTDLAIEVANKAKEAGLKQFIFMSSMIVYGESAPYGKEKMIERDTKPSPANFYGDSKWQADKGLRALDCDTFKVAILRPPMIYGKGSKGNYPMLANIAKKLPVFPDVKNHRSMLHIDNFCEFVCNLIMAGERGVYFPQNAEYTRTSDMVKMIGDVTGKPVKLVKAANIAVFVASFVPGKISGLVNKAFGSFTYEYSLSNYAGLEYQIVDTRQSICLTEKGIHSERIKVCIVNCFDTYEDRVDLLHDYFKSIGANVRVITSKYRHFEKCIRNDTKSDFEFVEAIPYKRNMSLKRIISHIVFSKAAFSRINNENYDLVWVLVPPNSFVKHAAAYKKKHPDTKLVFDLIDLWPETMPISKFKSLPPFYYWKRLRDKHLRVADSIVTECNLFHQKLPKTISTANIHTIYLAREIKPLSGDSDIADDSISLCYLGSINNIIDIPAIVDLIKGIKEYKPVELHIIGDGEKREVLIDACKKAGASVVYHGKIYDDKEKQRIFDKCHYGLNFMKESVFVGLTMKSIDYFEAGLPVINNIHGDTWSIIEKYQLGYNYVGKQDINNLIDYDMEMRHRSRAFFIDKLSIENFNKSIDNMLKPKAVTTSTRVFAGIVTFNPDMERLRENINAIHNQVERVIIVDNGSDNADKVRELGSDDIDVVLNGDNLGIAAALNIAMTRAKSYGAGWVITLDQDSVCPEDFIEKASPFLTSVEIGQIVPVLFESQSSKYYYLGDKLNKKTIQFVQKSITSASITNISIWETVGKFDENLFIDYVDYDYAFRLRLAGFKILRLNTVVLDQRIGKSSIKKIGPISVRVSNHSAFRKYYISRNIVVFIRRYGKEGNSFAEILRLSKMIGLTLLYEDDKKEKLHAIIHGIRDGLSYEA